MVGRRVILTGTTLVLASTFMILKPSAPGAGGFDDMTADVLRTLLAEHTTRHQHAAPVRMGRLSRLADGVEGGGEAIPHAAVESALSQGAGSDPQHASELAAALDGPAQPRNGVNWDSRLSAKSKPGGSTLHAATANAATSIVDFTNAYIILLMRDANRVKLVTGLTREEFPGAHIWPAIDGACISDSQVQDWKTQGYLKNSLP